MSGCLIVVVQWPVSCRRSSGEGWGDGRRTARGVHTATIPRHLLVNCTYILHPCTHRFCRAEVSPEFADTVWLDFLHIELVLLASPNPWHVFNLQTPPPAISVRTILAWTSASRGDSNPHHKNFSIAHILCLLYQSS